MTFPRYPAYKDSGVEWLGEIPEHWAATPLKRMLSRNDSGVWGDEPESDDDPIVLRSTEQGIGGEWQITDPARRKLSKTDIEKSLLYQNDLLVTKSSGSEAHIGKASLVTPEVAALRPCYSNFMQRLRVTADHSPSFVHFILNNRIAREQMAFLSSSSTGLANLNATVIGQVRAAAPPLMEQTSIAAFLAHETSKIDVLIAEQQNLIALLKEKRQAVISHAVTKGLNPDAPMKESGVEWLGEVPEHWVTPPLSFRYTSELGKMLDTARISGDHPVPYLRNVDVQWDRFNLDDLPVMDIKPSEYERYTVKPGDLMVCEGGEVGRTAIVPHISGVLGFQKALHRLRAASSAEIPRFMFYTLSCAASLGVFTMAGLSTIAHLTGEQLRRYRFPTPPPDEQTAIVAFLDRETAKIDSLIAEGEHAVDLLQERRAALISSAVTGKIDVRGLMRQEAA